MYTVLKHEIFGVRFAKPHHRHALVIVHLPLASIKMVYTIPCIVSTEHSSYTYFLAAMVFYTCSRLECVPLL